MRERHCGEQGQRAARFHEPLRARRIRVPVPRQVAPEPDRAVHTQPRHRQFAATGSAMLAVMVIQPSSCQGAKWTFMPITAARCCMAGTV